MNKVYIDGSAGTTGLSIRERLMDRRDIQLIEADDTLRKDPDYRRMMINSADIVFLCLPDDAAREAVRMTVDPAVRLIDTSTAHRTAEGWVYGFPELRGQRSLIKNAARVANPGCHASGFIALIRPLVEGGLLRKDSELSCFSLTGYSGGGKKMIAAYEEPERDSLLDAPRMYGLTQQHKHLKEMQAVCGLEKSPVFCPIVAPYYAGMEVTIPLFADQISGTLADIADCYQSYYREGLVSFVSGSEEGFLSANILSGCDDMQVSVHGNDERLLLVARFDNLGKGACGAAIQNMNIMLGADEFTGLRRKGE